MLCENFCSGWLRLPLFWENVILDRSRLPDQSRHLFPLWLGAVNLAWQSQFFLVVYVQIASLSTLSQCMSFKSCLAAYIKVRKEGLMLKDDMWIEKCLLRSFICWWICQSKRWRGKKTRVWHLMWVKMNPYLDVQPGRTFCRKVWLTARKKSQTDYICHKQMVILSYTNVRILAINIEHIDIFILATVVKHVVWWI